MPGMRRREFIALLGGAAAAWPLAAHAQQPERIRRVGVLTGAGGPNDEEAPARKAALEQGLQRAGWVEGGNLRIDYRFPAANPEATRKYAAELVALAPDVIVSSGTASMAPLLQATPPCLLCLSMSPTQWAPALSTVWLDRAETSLDFCSSNIASAENGWNCSRRSHRA